MAMQDCTKFLGKRVGYWTEYVCNLPFPPSYRTGVIVATFNPAKGYEKMVGNEVLFLRDGQDEPDFISGEYNFEVLE